MVIFTNNFFNIKKLFYIFGKNNKKSIDLTEEKKIKLIMLIEEKLNENRIIVTQGSNQSTAKKIKNNY